MAASHLCPDRGSQILSDFVRIASGFQNFWRSKFVRIGDYSHQYRPEMEEKSKKVLRTVHLKPPTFTLNRPATKT